MRSTFVCLHCGGTFLRHPCSKDQQYCNAKECRKASRRAWKKRNYQTNASYRQKTLEQQKKWRKKRSFHEYMNEYRKRRPEYERRNRELQKERNEKRKKEQGQKIVNRNTLTLQPGGGGLYALMPVKDGKIVNRNTLMVRMQVLSGEGSVLTQESV